MDTLLERVNEPLLEDAVRHGIKFEDAVSQFSKVLLRVFGKQDIPPEIPAAFGRQKLLEGSLSAREAAVFYSGTGRVTAEAVKKATRQLKVLAVRGKGGELRFPRWQFLDQGGVVPGLQDVLIELSQSPVGQDVGAIAFFQNPNPLTGGERPIDALKAGRKDDVMLAAVDARY